MFDFSFPELVLCLLVALVVLGPEKLPRVARTLGRWAGQARGYLRNLTAELDREGQLADLKKQLQQADRAIREQADAFKAETQSTVDQLRDDARAAEQALKPQPANVADPVADDANKPVPPSP